MNLSQHYTSVFLQSYSNNPLVMYYGNPSHVIKPGEFLEPSVVNNLKIMSDTSRGPSCFSNNS